MRSNSRTLRKTLPILPRVTHFWASGTGASLLLAIFFLTMSSGCTSCREYVANGFKVGPNYCRPAAPVAEGWIDANDPSIDGGEIQNAAWWQSFQDPVLESLISSACQQNLSLRVAGLRILEARAQRAIVAGEIFPQSQAAAGDFTRIGLSKNGPSGSSPKLNFDEWTLGGSLSWELDFWGKFRRAIEAADANLDASIESYDQVLVLLLSEVAQSYSDVRIAEQRLTYAKQNLEIQQGSLNLAKDRLREGAVTKLDVTQATSNFEQTDASIRPLEAARRRAANQLCILMGIPPRNLDDMLTNHHGIPKAAPHLAIGIPAELLRRRPDVRKAEREVAAQSALIGVATSELYPHFSIDGTIYVDALEVKDLFSGDSVAGAVGPAFRWNILNYGRLKNNILVQKTRFQQLVVQYQDVVLQANTEAENAIISFLKSQQQVQSLAKSAAASAESVDLVSSQYQEGTVDFNRVFTVQRELTQQQDNLAVAEGAVAQYLIQLYRALGGGWQVRLDNPSMQFTVATDQKTAEAAPVPEIPEPPKTPENTPKKAPAPEKSPAPPAKQP